jgi:phenylpropionate dioxygenase-like ring-hydroxylating dioxygenase large terminal subunit
MLICLNELQICNKYQHNSKETIPYNEIQCTATLSWNVVWDKLSDWKKQLQNLKETQKEIRFINKLYTEIIQIYKKDIKYNSTA